MANLFKLTDKVGVNVALKLLVNNLAFARLASTEYAKMFGNQKEQFGSRITGRRQIELVTQDNAISDGTFTRQDIVTGSFEINIDRRRVVGYEWTAGQRELEVDDWLKDSSLNAAMAQLAQSIESDVADKHLEFHNWVGTPGQTVKTPGQFFAATERLNLEAVPMDMQRRGVITPQDRTALLSFFTAPAFNDSRTNEDALRRGKLPPFDDIDAYTAQTTVAITTGTRTNGAVDGASQNVNYTAVRDGYTQTIAVDGLGAGATVKRGEVFTIANVRAVNPRNKQVQTYLREFKVLEDAEADSAGEALLTISPPIIAATGSGATLLTNRAYQTVDSVPANDAVVTFKGSANTTYNVNSVFHRSAIQIAYVQPTAPVGIGEWNFATDPESGISLRVWKASDFDTDVHGIRFDVIYGVNNVDRRLGTQLSGAALV